MLGLALLTLPLKGFTQINSLSKMIVLDPKQSSPKTPAKLVIQDVKIGKGLPVVFGDIVSVDYTGKLQSGKVFDATSLDGGKPFTFEVGFQSVIKGWDQGLLGMQTGGVRNLVIPPALAYGPNGRPPVIPANSTLNFNIVLHKIIHVSHLIKETTTKPGTGTGLKLGDNTYLTLKITDSSGKVFKQVSTPVLVPISPQFGPPLLGLLGTKLGEKRTVAIPTALLDPASQSKIVGPILIYVKIYGINGKYIKGFTPPKTPTDTGTPPPSGTQSSNSSTKKGN